MTIAHWPFISHITAAFLMGLAGSLHCAGMCGGIVAAISFGSRKAGWPGLSAYHVSRVAGYGALGALLGMLGLFAAGAQLWLSVAAGLFMIIFAASLAGWLPERIISRIPSPLPASVLRKVADSGSIPTYGLLGFLNGFLPCGLVYAALALALETGSVPGGAVTMIAFGAGTVPALAGVSAFIRVIPVERKALLLKLMALVLMISGLMMVAKPFMMGEKLKAKATGVIMRDGSAVGGHMH